MVEDALHTHLHLLEPAPRISIDTPMPHTHSTQSYLIDD